MSAGATRVVRTPAIVVFAALIVASLRIPYLLMLGADAEAVHRAFTTLPDSATPEYPAFLAEVARRTHPGDSIAIVVPRPWNGGYAYAYYRAWWFLPDRRVLPVTWRADERLLENFEGADYVASWRVGISDPGLDPVWSGHRGMLFRRRSR